MRVDRPVECSIAMIDKSVVLTRRRELSVSVGGGQTQAGHRQHLQAVQLSPACSTIDLLLSMGAMNTSTCC